MKKVIWAVVIVVVIVLGGLGFTIWRNSHIPPVAKDCATGITTIYYTSQGSFLPSCFRVSSGTTITYVNQRDKTLDVAADPHPVHTGNKEVSSNKFTLEVKPGESVQVKLEKKGTFGIHDHENASARAVVIVE